MDIVPEDGSSQGRIQLFQLGEMILLTSVFTFFFLIFFLFLNLFKPWYLKEKRSTIDQSLSSMDAG